ncbi:DUF3304 domain-containing protein [Chromobacterium vaccinii]|uniref:DUF3304 domain-containing protein n=1 Tax=Chromobacterium vaccinii TaxID=1108595 RepID=UPI0009E246B7|nr:DUF3304 domain-containing protein [Chromobacterium vaccinii]
MRLLLTILFIATLTGCKDEMVAVPVGAYNYTNHDINTVWANGKWVGGPRVNEGGGTAGSIELPMKYASGTIVKVEWQRNACIHGTPDCKKRDASGNIIQVFGSKTVTIPPYDGETMAEVQILLLPNNEVRIYADNRGITHPDHPSHKEFGNILDDGLRPLDGIWPTDKKGASK